MEKKIISKYARNNGHLVFIPDFRIFEGKQYSIISDIPIPIDHLKVTDNIEELLQEGDMIGYRDVLTNEKYYCRLFNLDTYIKGLGFYFETSEIPHKFSFKEFKEYDCEVVEILIKDKYGYQIEATLENGKAFDYKAKVSFEEWKNKKWVII